MFRIKLLATALFLTGFLGAFPLHAQSDAQQKMIAADRALWEVLAGSPFDSAAYVQMLAPDYFDVTQGAVHTRKEGVEQNKLIRDFKYQYENPRAVILSPTSGFVVAEVSYFGTMNGSGFKNKVLTTTVFSLESGRWLAHVQMTEPMEPEKKAIIVPDDDPVLVALRALAVQVEDKVHVPGYGAFTPPKIMLDAGMGVSFFAHPHNTVHSSQLKDLPPPMQNVWKEWASYTTDEPNGQSLFDDMFHRFFFVHELGHWMAGQVIAGLPDSDRITVAKNETGNKWETETSANRIAVAWYREHDPQYLAKLVADFRLIESHLPDPVPAGMDKKAYFTENYAKLGKDPMAYGWYQLQMVLVVYDEPVKSFQQVLDALPKNRYE
jgi:hypothetical protein